MIKNIFSSNSFAVSPAQVNLDKNQHIGTQTIWL